MLACVQEAKCDLDQADSYGKTPAYMAARDGHESCLLLLKEAGCDLGQADDYGETPAYMAVKYGHEACLRVLMKLGAILTNQTLLVRLLHIGLLVTVTRAACNC